MSYIRRGPQYRRPAQDPYWYEVEPTGHGNYTVTVWDSRAKGTVLYANVFGSYKTASSVGRAWKLRQGREGAHDLPH